MQTEHDQLAAGLQSTIGARRTWDNLAAITMTYRSNLTCELDLCQQGLHNLLAVSSQQACAVHPTPSCTVHCSRMSTD